MDSFFGNIHRKTLAAMLVSRLIFKRSVKEAKDAESVAVQTWQSWQCGNTRLAVVSTICAHMVFASVGAGKVVDQIREFGERWMFSRRSLKKIHDVLEPLPMEDQRKLSDYSVTLT
eukprot:2769144-Karenia_brevis.AAC.1